MTLSPFAAIHAAGIATRDVRYPWDEWRVRDYYLGADDGMEDEMFERLTGLSNCATIGLAVATGEWVCHRLSLVDADATPLQFLEAAWAGIVHPAYCEYTETDDDEWRGPVRGPLNMTITIVNDALFCLDEDPQAANRAAWMYNLARHILPDTAAYDGWFELVVQRLETYCPRPGEQDEDLFAEVPGMGEPVPRDLYDTGLPYDPADRAQLIDRYLGRLDPNRNPFLRSPKDLAHVPELQGRIYRYF